MKNGMIKYSLLMMIFATLFFSGCSGSSGDSSTTNTGSTTTPGTTTPTSPAGTVPLLATPVIIAIDTLTSASLTIHWNAISGATGYDLFRDTSATGAFTTQVNSTHISGTSYTDNSLVGNTAYYYKLCATDGTTDSAKSGYISSTTLGRAVAALFPAPSSLSVSEGTFASYVQLTWEAIPGYSVLGYNVYRCTTNYGVATLLNSSPIGSMTYNDTTAVPGTIYYYYACGVSGTSEGAWTTCKFGYR